MTEFDCSMFVFHCYILCFYCLPVSISLSPVTFLFSSSSGLSICGHNCLLTAEWMSASKIVCRVGPAKDDKGEIIVTTKSGGLGTSTVSFKLLRPDSIGEAHAIGALFDLNSAQMSFSILEILELNLQHVFLCLGILFILVYLICESVCPAACVCHLHVYNVCSLYIRKSEENYKHQTQENDLYIMCFS